MSHPLQLAQDDRNPVLLGQAAQLAIELQESIVRRLLPRSSGHRDGRHGAFPPPPPGPVRPRLQGRPVRHAMEPDSHLVTRHDRGRPPHEHEEGRLEGVLGIVVIAEDAAADAPDHRAVAMNEGPERLGLSVVHEPIQQLPVRMDSMDTEIEERLDITGQSTHTVIHRLINPLGGRDGFPLGYYPIG